MCLHFTFAPLLFALSVEPCLVVIPVISVPRLRFLFKSVSLGREANDDAGVVSVWRPYAVTQHWLLAQLLSLKHVISLNWVRTDFKLKIIQFKGSVCVSRWVSLTSSCVWMWLRASFLFMCMRVQVPVQLQCVCACARGPCGHAACCPGEQEEQLSHWKDREKEREKERERDWDHWDHYVWPHYALCLW